MYDPVTGTRRCPEKGGTHMTEDPNATRESIKDFILSWPTQDKQLHLKRSMTRTPSTAVLLGDVAPNWGVALQGSNGDVLTYPDLDALLDHGWVID
jgi:hypothetical protein